MELVQQRGEVALRRRVEPLERLVHDEELGLEHERAGERDLALLAAREQVADLVLQVRDADLLEHGVDHAVDLGLGIAVIARRERHVVPHRRRGSARRRSAARRPRARGSC
jgi:hypothetical protein